MSTSSSESQTEIGFTPMQSDHTHKMTRQERRASVGLASIFAFRMFGLFLILPVFAIYAQHLPGGENKTLVGFALGAYGLTQAILQIPAGWLSDRIGRKPVIYLGLVIFALGSIIAGMAHDIYWIIVGRCVQGSGAIAAAVIALTADLTREEQRTKAMAMIGMTIGLTFSLSLMLAPWLDKTVGVSGMFFLTAFLAIFGLFIMRFIVPSPEISRRRADTSPVLTQFKRVLTHPELLRLNFGIFILHAILTSIFTAVPFILVKNHLEVNSHWHIYLPVMIIAFILMVPPIAYGEKKAKLKPVFLFAISLLIMSVLGLGQPIIQNSLMLTGLSLVLFFWGFNLLEASLPSLISKVAPADSKGTAIGIYNTFEFFGAFLGGISGGYIAQHYALSNVFLFNAALVTIWFAVAATMQPPQAVKTKTFDLSKTHFANLNHETAQDLAKELSAIEGISEVVVIPEDQIAYMKVSQKYWDEAAVYNLLYLK